MRCIWSKLKFNVCVCVYIGIILFCFGAVCARSTAMNLSPNAFTFDLIEGGHLRGIATSNDRIVAVGDGGRIKMSVDGLNWSSFSSNTTQNLRDVVVAFGRFYAVGQQGVVLSSKDGIVWEKIETDALNNLKGIATNGTTLVAVGTNSKSQGVLWSTRDGYRWKKSDQMVMAGLEAVTFGGGLFIAVGQEGSLMTSTDGELWARQNTGTQNHLNDIFAEKENYIAVGNSGKVLVSRNATQWVEREIGEEWKNVAFRGAWVEKGQTIIVGDFGTILTSWDRQTWQKRVSNTNSNLEDVLWWKDRFVVVGAGEKILVSLDGVSFQSKISETIGPLRGVTWNGEIFLAVGDQGLLYISEDGFRWDVGSVGSNVQLNAIASRGDTYIAVGEKGVILHSKDAKNWVKQNSGIQTSLNDVCWGGDRFLAVGEEGVVLSSPDGVAWSLFRMQEKVRLKSVVWNEREFYILGHPQTGYFTKDGLKFKTERILDGSFFEDILWNGFSYVAVGEGMFATSNDGINWEKYALDANARLLGVGFNGARMVVVGVYGTSLSRYRLILASMPKSPILRNVENGFSIHSISNDMELIIYNSALKPVGELFVNAGESANYFSVGAGDYFVRGIEGEFLGLPSNIVTVYPVNVSVNASKPEITAVKNGWRWTSGTTGTGVFRYAVNNPTIESGIETNETTYTLNTMDAGEYTLYLQEKNIDGWSSVVSSIVRVQGTTRGERILAQLQSREWTGSDEDMEQLKSVIEQLATDFEWEYTQKKQSDGMATAGSFPQSESSIHILPKEEREAILEAIADAIRMMYDYTDKDLSIDNIVFFKKVLNAITGLERIQDEIKEVYFVLQTISAALIEEESTQSIPILEGRNEVVLSSQRLENVLTRSKQISTQLTEAFRAIGMEQRIQPRHIFSLQEKEMRDKISYTLPKITIQKFLEENVRHVVLRSLQFDVSLDLGVFENVYEDIIIEILKENMPMKNPAFKVEVRFKSGVQGKSIDVPFNLSVRYELPSNPEVVTAFTMRNGQWEPMMSDYDSSKQRLNVRGVRSGVYAVGLNAVQFRDVTKDWMKKFTEEMAAKGIVQGFPDGRFKPDDFLTRAEFVTMAVKTFQLKTGQVQTHFKDVNADDWFYEPVSIAYQNQLVAGYNDGTFQPKERMTREEMATVVQKIFNQFLRINQTPNQIVLNIYFEDADNIQSYAKDAVALLYRYGILKGYQNQFRPKMVTTRAEGAAVMAQLMKFYYKD